MPSRTTLLSNYPTIRTRDPEYARDRIFSLFGATSFEVPSSESGFETSANHLQVGDLIVYYCAFSSDKPIDIEAMSAVAKISARSLFRQFTRSRGYSPADFAKRIRLDRVREMLEQAEGNASVTQIAMKCGFQNPGHFARDFRLAFGELPSETLRRSGRRLIS